MQMICYQIIVFSLQAKHDAIVHILAPFSAMPVENKGQVEIKVRSNTVQCKWKILLEKRLF